MKKVLFLLLILLMSNSKKGLAQEITKTLMNVNAYTATLVYEAKIKSNDTIYQTYLYGYDERYRTLASRVIILFLEDTMQQDFINDLKKAKEFILNETSDDVLFDKTYYQIRIGKGFYGKPTVMLYGPKTRGNGYFSVRLKDIDKIIEKLSSYRLGQWLNTNDNNK
jgi:hypothetical protein